MTDGSECRSICLIRFFPEADRIVLDFDGLPHLSENGDTHCRKAELHRLIERRTIRHRSTDDDDDSSTAMVPFQVAYAVSIHKAQGLEYSSVKIVITNEVEELITHNIFYTAITRAKEKLKIYWTPEAEQHVLNSMEKRDYNRDANLLKSLFTL